MKFRRLTDADIDLSWFVAKSPTHYVDSEGGEVLVDADDLVIRDDDGTEQRAPASAVRAVLMVGWNEKLGAIAHLVRGQACEDAVVELLAGMEIECLMPEED